ncbi:reverse transcriptase domain-containing protein [Tanacetum coccineum]
MKMLTDKYCPRGEIKKLKIKIWNLKVKGTDVASYTQRFQELAMMCGRMFPEESDQVEKYVGGLPDMIRGSVMESKPKTMEDAIERNVARAYSARFSEKKEYAGTLPSAATNNQRTLTCYESRNQGHYRSDCPELKNQNHGNQDEGTKARGMVYALGGGETNQDLDNMEDDINA